MNNQTCIPRTFTRFAIVLFTAGALFASCKKDSSADDNAITNDDVAETISQSFSASSGGMMLETQGATELAIQNKLVCGQTKDSAISAASAPGSPITWAFSYHFTRSLACTEGIPSSLTFQSEGKSSYTTSRMSSKDSSYGQTVITQLAPSAVNLLVNQQYVRKGSQQSLIRAQRSFTSTITFTGTNITISKSTRMILSGTATVQFEGKSSNGVTVIRSGTITFDGNQKATLKLLNGATYPLQW